MHLIHRFAKCDSGATAIEYALIAGLVSIVIVATLGIVGTSLTSLYDRVAQSVGQAAGT